MQLNSHAVAGFISQLFSIIMVCFNSCYRTDLSIQIYPSTSMALYFSYVLIFTLSLYFSNNMRTFVQPHFAISIISYSHCKPLSYFYNQFLFHFLHSSGMQLGCTVLEKTDIAIYLFSAIQCMLRYEKNQEYSPELFCSGFDTFKWRRVPVRVMFDE